MAYMQVEMFSQALHMAVGVDVILPQLPEVLPYGSHW